MEPMTLATLLTDVTSIFTAGIGWVGTVASTIEGEPMLLMFVLLPLIGVGIGLFRRLLNVQ